MPEGQKVVYGKIVCYIDHICKRYLHTKNIIYIFLLVYKNIDTGKNSVKY